MSLYSIRKLTKNDYNTNYLSLLTQLTSIEPDKISQDMFNTFVENLNDKHQVIVIEEPKLNTIIGTITIIIEPKLIHNMGLVGHIEDIVVDINFRRLGLSKLLVSKVVEIAQKHNCYKVILDCNDLNKQIYEKIGFINNGNQMSLYF
jgi:glucosamine-phosphate N-acetyltransferase